VGTGGTILKTTNGGLTFDEKIRSPKSNFHIFPNPASQSISITNDQHLFESVTVTILQLNGNKINRQKFHNQEMIEMAVSNLTKGIYLLKIETTEGIEVKKFVKQ
jgi:hypothetical protein